MYFFLVFFPLLLLVVKHHIGYALCPFPQVSSSLAELSKQWTTAGTLSASAATSVSKSWQTSDLSRMLAGRSFYPCQVWVDKVTTTRSCLCSHWTIRQCFRTLNLRYRESELVPVRRGPCNFCAAVLGCHLCSWADKKSYRYLKCSFLSISQITWIGINNFLYKK